MSSFRQVVRESAAWRSIGRPIARPASIIVTRVVGLVFGAVAPALALISRFSHRSIDVGLGPEPLINNVYHKKALELFGYSAETFVSQVYFITSDFDVRADLRVRWPFEFLLEYYVFVRALFRYKCLYIYFNGGPLMSRPRAWRYEPWLYRLAGMKVVVMPYGGDVQEMTRSRNLLFKHVMASDYPGHRLRRARTARQIDLWTSHADHVLSGVEWVDYMYHWDTLQLGHFSIDLEQWRVAPERPADGPLKLFHAPNHRGIKGTDHFVRAVDELRQEGVDVELVMREKVPNSEIRDLMSEVDVVADQLVVGWYAMFALEAMAMGKPVLCYLREDLVNLYTCAGLVEPGEIPIVNCTPLTVKDAIRHLAEHRETLADLGRRGREYVEHHHSIAVIGSQFDRINRGIGIMPSGTSIRS